MKFICHLIWDYLWNRRGKAGVFSADQLAYKTSSLMHNPSIRIRMEAELTPGPYAAETVDEAMERVFEFDRNWAGFELPRLVMAVSRIQDVIFQKKFKISGDYSYFASQLECLFRNPVTLALDEFGLPMQISEKIDKAIGFSDDIDQALAQLKKVSVERIGLHGFEQMLFTEVRKYF